MLFGRRRHCGVLAALPPTVVTAYLERIGYPPVEAPNSEALASLQDAHVRSFEHGELGPRFDHARILVDVDEPVDVDVGTGASPRGPIGLADRPQTIGPATYLTREVDGRYLTEHRDGDTWTPGWSFDTTARRLDDFAERCHYHQSSPVSPFPQKALCTLVTDDGQVTLSGRQLITTTGDTRTEVEVADPLDVLQRRFGISLERWSGS